MHPLVYLHGSHSSSVLPSDAPLYLTPNPDYGHIQSLPYTYSCQLALTTPYHVDSVGAIERLRSHPEQMAALRQAGYDAVVYCAPHQPTRGASGWGNDAAQYLVLDTSKIRHWQPCERPAPTPLHTEKPSLSKVVYHATDTHFQAFEHTTDIGFHFGSAEAADARQSSLPELTIEHVTPSELDVLSLQAANQQLPTTPQGDMLGRALRCLGHPKLEAIKSILDMDVEALADIAGEFRGKPDHPNFQQRCHRAQNGERFEVKEAGHTLYQVNSRSEAERLRSHVQQNYTKKAVLSLGRTLDVPDLGLWSARDVLLHAGANQAQLAELANASADKQNEVLKRTLNALGFDSLTYTNTVEAPGSVSHVVFSPAQIHLIPAKFEFHPSEQPDFAPSVSPQRP